MCAHADTRLSGIQLSRGQVGQQHDISFTHWSLLPEVPVISSSGWRRVKGEFCSISKGTELLPGKDNADVLVPLWE